MRLLNRHVGLMFAGPVVCLCVCLFVCVLYPCLLVSWFACSAGELFVRLMVHLCIRFDSCLFVFACACLFVCPFACLCDGPVG